VRTPGGQDGMGIFGGEEVVQASRMVVGRALDVYIGHVILTASNS